MPRVLGALAILLAASDLLADVAIPAVQPTLVTTYAGRPVEIAVRVAPVQAKSVPITVAPEPGLEVSATSVTVPPGGSVKLIVRGITPGTYRVRFTSSPEFGSHTGLLTVVVFESITPAIASVSPSTGPTAGDTEVRITGVRFIEQCAVYFGGVAAASSTFVDATTITAKTPARPPGTVAVELRCNREHGALANGFTFVSTPPAVTSVSPASGSAAGGTFVRVTGANLLSSCGVTFDGMLARGVTIESATSILALAPPHAPARVAVGVRCEAGEATLADAFTYVPRSDPPASITSVSAASAASGEIITIRGSGFLPTDRVFVGPSPALIVRSAPDAHVIHIPDLSPTDWNVFVNGVAGPSLIVVPAETPRVMAVTPQPAWPGLEIEVEGQGLRPSLRYFADQSWLTVIESDPERALVRIPASLRPGSHLLGVAAGNRTVAAAGLQIQSAGLAVLDVQPRCVPIAGGSTVTIAGTAFAADATVTFGGIPSPAVTVLEPTTIRAVVPAHVAGIAQIVVSSGGGTATLTRVLEYTSPFHVDDPCRAERRRSVRR